MINDSLSTKKGLIGYYSVAFVCLMKFFTSAILAYIIRSYSDISVENITLLITIPNMIGVAVSLLMGPISLKIRKKILVALMPITVFIYMMTFALIGSDGPFWMLVIAAIIAGYTQGAFSVIGIGYVADFTKPETRGKYIAIHNLFANGGSMVAFYIGGIIAAGNNGMNWPQAYWMGLACIPAILLFLIIAPKYTPVEEEYGIGGGADKGENESFADSIKGIKELPGILIAMALLQLVFYFAVSAYNQNISVYIIDEHSLGSSVQTGIATSIIRAMGIVCGLAYSLLNKNLKSWSVPFGYFLVSLGLLLLTKWHTVEAAYIAAILCGLGNTYAFATVYAAGTVRAGSKYSAVALSLIQGCVNLGTFLTPYALKYGALAMFGASTATTKITFGGVVGIACSILAIFVYTKYDKKHTAKEASN